MIITRGVIFREYSRQLFAIFHVSVGGDSHHVELYNSFA